MSPHQKRVDSLSKKIERLEVKVDKLQNQKAIKVMKLDAILLDTWVFLTLNIYVCASGPLRKLKKQFLCRHLK